MKLQDKVVLITGAGAGIGRATALRFAREGACVVASDLDEANLAETVERITADGGKAVAVVGNVSESDDVQHMVNDALSSFGRLDVLINNAGITRDGLAVRVKDGEVKKMSADKWDAVLDVNLKGTFLAAQAAAVPMMAQQSGRIINTTSVGAQGNIGQANYAASKAGVIGLTKTLALEWARYGILVNCVGPGGVKTQMTASIPEKLLERLVAGIPLRRMAEPEEIAAVHAFLASDDATYITGQVIWVDGGMTVGA